MTWSRWISVSVVWAVLVMWGAGPAARAVQAAGYDPLQVPPEWKAQRVELVVVDTKRQREIPILVYLPPAEAGADPKATADQAPLPGAGAGAGVVLFSHGLGGNRYGSSYLGEHWSGRGYVAVFVQHPGSDDSVWKGVRLSDRRAAMNRAASGENFMLRVGDIPAVLDQLEQWNAAAGHKLHGRLDMTKVGMSGHSFGAMTTQAVSGQTAPAGKGFTDARIDAAVIMSPSGPRRGDAATAFGNVKTPWLLMTGTHDLSPIGNIDMASRLSVYPALPPGGKYELVLDGAEHSAFTERALPGDQKPRNPNHHRAILALSTAFWDAYILQNADARHWLDHTGPPTLLQPADQWQSK